MADESLAAAGLYIDELNKIRVLEPEVAQQTAELKDECKEFVDSKSSSSSYKCSSLGVSASIIYCINIWQKLHVVHISKMKIHLSVLHLKVEQITIMIPFTYQINFLPFRN